MIENSLNKDYEYDTYIDNINENEIIDKYTKFITEDKKNYIKIKIIKDKDKYLGISIEYCNREDDFIYKKFRISNEELYVVLSNQVDGKNDFLRKFRYYRKDDCISSFIVEESNMNRKNIELFNNQLKYQGNIYNVSSPINISFQMLFDERNIKLINFVLNELDSKIKGLRKFIIDNFELNTNIDSDDYKHLETIDQIIEDIINTETAKKLTKLIKYDII